MKAKNYNPLYLAKLLDYNCILANGCFMVDDVEGLSTEEAIEALGFDPEEEVDEECIKRIRDQMEAETIPEAPWTSSCRWNIEVKNLTEYTGTEQRTLLILDPSEREIYTSTYIGNYSYPASVHNGRHRILCILPGDPECEIDFDLAKFLQDREDELDAIADCYLGGGTWINDLDPERRPTDADLDLLLMRFQEELDQDIIDRGQRLEGREEEEEEEEE